jgi:acyl-coenzyme A synthetase/AMP-(fatty) acid ligase
VADREGDVLTKESAFREVHIYNHLAMREYLNNKSGIDEAFTLDNWIHACDISCNRDKNWPVVDRAKDLIKVRGWQVSPVQIEAALVEHPNILDAGVIGIPAPDGCGESPMAFVVVEKGSSVDADQIKLFLATRLARYKNVEEVCFVEQIPRNPAGKILRRVLRDMRETEEPTPDQTAAREYAAALQQIDLYEKMKGSKSNSTAVSSRVAGSEEEVATSKKRKTCSTSQFWPWRKMRILSTS